MTVAKLIEKLSKFPDEKKVMIWCRNDPHDIKSVVFDDLTVWLDADNEE